jgi:hypothetical protein
MFSLSESREQSRDFQISRFPVASIGAKQQTRDTDNESQDYII